MTESQCNICGYSGEFLTPDRGREGWHCPNCSASARNRLVLYALGKMLNLEKLPVYLWPENKGTKILEPCPGGAQAVFLREKFDYCDPEFDPDKIKQGADPRQYADIQQLAFAAETFDVIIASEVFEHVREDLKGFREVYRTLKPGGIFILTVPYDHQQPQTLVRVEVRGDQDIHLAPPRYHGGSGATLEYRQYGRDLLARLHEAGFAVGYFEAEIPRHRIPRSSIIVCRKSHYFEFAPAWREAGAHEARLPSMGPLLPFRLFVLYKFNLKSFWHYLREIKSKAAGRRGAAAHHPPGKK